MFSIAAFSLFIVAYFTVALLIVVSTCSDARPFQAPAPIGPAGSLVKFKHGFVWTDGASLRYDPGERVGLIVESFVRSSATAGLISKIDARALNSREHATAIHAAVDSGGDHFIRVSLGDRCAWIEADARGVEVL